MGRNKKISLFDRIEDKNNSTLHLLFSVDISSDIRDIRYRQSFSIKLKEGSRGYVFWGDGTMTTVFPKVGDLSSVSHAYSTSKTPNYRIEVWADTPDALLGEGFSLRKLTLDVAAILDGYILMLYRLIRSLTFLVLRKLFWKTRKENYWSYPVFLP